MNQTTTESLKQLWHSFTGDADVVTTDPRVHSMIWIRGYGMADHWDDFGLLVRVLHAKERGAVGEETRLVVAAPSPLAGPSFDRTLRAQPKRPQLLDRRTA